jgi:TorA maturation chaperone TorD
VPQWPIDLDAVEESLLGTLAERLGLSEQEALDWLVRSGLQQVAESGFARLLAGDGSPPAPPWGTAS